MHLAQAELGGRLVVGDPADAVRAELQRALEQLLVAGVRVDPVLRERGHLDRDQVGHLVPQPQQALERRLVLRRHVRVGADEERALRRRPAHDLARALEDVLGREALLQLAPDVDPLDQRPRLVEARLARRERRVEVEVAVDERRRDEPAVRVELRVGVEPEARPDPRPAPALGREVDRAVAAGEARVADHEVCHRVTVNRCRSRRTARSTPR